jgi:hypothetical protein
MEDGLEVTEEGGRELRVPVGEPSGVNTADRSVVAVLQGFRFLVDLHSSGSVGRDFRLESYCVSGGITRIEGAAGWVLVLGSGLLGSDGSA